MIITEFKKSQDYRDRIHDLIPGGAHTYSKGDDQFPLLSPAAIKKGSGAYVWDLDDNKFLDCSMALTSVSLGHAFEPVVDRVIEEIKKGINFSRPSFLEKDVAEKFLSLVPCHDQIKFAKNGSTITTAAVKLARAYTGRDLIAFPGDHPFYSYDDWYIGSKACNKGVSQSIADLSVSYDSSDLTTLEKLFEQHPGKIACVITEPEKNDLIAREYMLKLQAITHKNSSILIIDEMITGFKTDLPGSITKYGITPDLAAWGKGIANGFSFCALTGKKEIMEIGGIRKTGDEKVFLISTTHGGEVSGLAASLATTEFFEKHEVIEHNHSIGRQLWNKVNALIQKKGLSEYINLVGHDWMFGHQFNSRERKNCSGMYTLMQQEMIKNGVLFNGIFVPCYSHNEVEVEHFEKAFEASLEIYSKALETGFENFLKGPPVKAVFRKYI